MKPHEARAMRRRQEQAKAARGDKLEAYLHAGHNTAAVVPDLIPTETDLQAAIGDVRALVRRANRTVKGSRRGKVLDDLLVAFARLIYVERVLDLDRLERAALTPARLAVLSRISPEDLHALQARWQGEALASGLVMPA